MQPAGHVFETCVRSCVDCNFSTSVTSVDIKLYRYFLICLSLVTEDITKWYNTRTSIKVLYNVLFVFVKTIHIFHSKNAWHPSVWIYEISIHLLYGNTLDIHANIPSWSRSICVLRWPFLANFFWQMWHVNQVPSLCDCSRCVLSWL